MCGRYALTSPPAAIAERFHLLWTPEIAPHYNIAPSQMVPAVRETGEGREVAFLKWGLIPWWARDAHVGAKLVNARAESLAEKPAFRDAYRHRHCVVPADAFYEWKAVAGRKQPYCVRMRDTSLFGMAGLWERWKASDGQVVESCAIVTVDANPLVAPLHDRMPLILAPADYDAWLAAATLALPHAVPAEEMTAYPVSPIVSDAKNDVPA
ncbi:MAG TPA: SOS response-associated peptidase, partial [Thiobacillaceae bacterium]